MRVLKAFVGFQIESDFQTLAELKVALTSLEATLRDEHGISLDVKYGIFPASTILWEQITQSIFESDIALFDISENNRNVLIEVGLAYGSEKRVFLLKNRDSEETHTVPPDLAAVYVTYARDQLTSGGLTATLVDGIQDYLTKNHPPHFYIKRLWGFAQDSEVRVICSELDEPEERQHPEPKEYLYLSKYGDVDGLVAVLSTLNRLYPQLRVTYQSSGEAVAAGNQDYSGNLVLVGGPDYNEVTAMFEGYSPFAYFQYGTAEEEIALRDKISGKEYVPTDPSGIGDVDYGFFAKMRNPHNPEHRLIMVGGTHATGVLGAIKAFSYHEPTSGVPYRNCRAIVEDFGDDPTFKALFEVRSVGLDVQTPRIADATLAEI